MSAPPAKVTVWLYRAVTPGEAHLRLREILAQAGAGGRVVRQGEGKPALADDALHFSFAHRECWCVVAASSDCPVGVDVETRQAVADFAGVVQAFFPPEARAEWAAARGSEQPAVFYRWWTRLEAAGKACGVGLDEAQQCLPRVRLESLDRLPQLAVSVAARTSGAIDVRWEAVYA